MIVYKCKKCNGEMVIDPSGALYCAYCGAKGNFSDAELEGYREFRGQMLNYLKNLHDTEEGDSYLDMLWGRAETVTFISDDDTDITVSYLYTATEGPATMYFARKNVLYYFPKEQEMYADKMENELSKLQFPPADIKGLDRCFPKITGRFNLKDGGKLLAFAKEDTVFPLAMYGALPYQHVAWIISRMENICCVLEYSELCHDGISPDALFINPVTHEARLYGGWWACHAKNNNPMAINRDLSAIRKVALRVLGYRNSDVPFAMKKFLGKETRATAYDDFSEWDEVIEKNLGGRHFHKMDATDGLNM